MYDRVLAKAMNIKWQDKVQDTAVLNTPGIHRIDSLLMQSQTSGSVIRMTNHRLPKVIFYGKMQNGKRPQGGRKKCFKDTLKISLKSVGMV